MTFTERNHNQALSLMSRMFAKIKSSDEVLAELVGGPAAAVSAAARAVHRASLWVRRVITHRLH